MNLKKIQSIVTLLGKNNIESYSYVVRAINRIAQEQSVNLDLMQCKIIRLCRTYIEELNNFSSKGGPKPTIVPDRDMQKVYHVLCPNLNRQLEVYIKKETLKQAKAESNKSSLTANNQSNLLKP